MYILSNKQYECYTDEFYTYLFCLVLPLLIFWLFVLPLSMFYLLKKNKKNLKKNYVMLKYGFLYKEYTDKCYYWEFIKVL
jgi:hypothetical protein